VIALRLRHAFLLLIGQLRVRSPDPNMRAAAARSLHLRAAVPQGLTLVHFSAQLEPFLKKTHTLHTP